MGAIMEIQIDIATEDEGMDLLINDYVFSGPSSFEPYLLNSLAEYALVLGKEGIVINSTDERTEAVLESNGFEIVERHDYAGLVTGVRELPADEDAQNLEQKALDDLDAIAEIADHAQAEVETGDLDGLAGSVDAIANRASAWSDPQ